MKTGKLAMIKGKQGKTARLFLAVLFLCLVPNITVHAKGNQDVILSNPDAIEAAFKKAVDTLAMGLQTPTETIIGSFTIDGSDTPTELSVYLTNKAAEYAENSPSKRYIVVEGSGDNRALLSGSFNKLNDRVDVTVNLTTPTGEGNGTQKLSLSLKEIIRWEVALEIENQENMDALEEIFTALAEEKQESAQIQNTAQGIRIQAWFNSESRTFMHRDELKMTVMADKNCYFKIIHIDADNQMKMIYPNSSDKNNELKANIPRNIFETASYMLYGPYGAETLLVVAQSKQFENIERDYISPWIPVTAEAVRAAVRGKRGGDLESSPISFSGEGEARYTITILKPHEEYEYGKPENMALLVQNMRNEALQQGGTFEGNETSGFSVVNNVRISYRVPRDSPNTIQFALYNLDNFTGGRNARGQKRNTGYNFSFEKPLNIAVAIKTLQTQIESKGGVFNGNEQQGSFKANGIAGQYRVTNLVSVTITEKPVLVPNSLIEREVKNYFGGR